MAQTVLVAHTESEYQRLGALLDELVDEVGNDKSHPLASLMEVVGLLIEKYEDEQFRKWRNRASCGRAAGG